LEDLVLVLTDKG